MSALAVDIGEDDSLTTFQETAQFGSPTNARLGSPSNYGSPTHMAASMVRQSNLSSNLLAQTGGLIPVTGFTQHKMSKGSPKGKLKAKSQLKSSLVPNDDALSSFIEAGQVYGFRHVDKDTESHINSSLIPLEEFDAGIGFEGWYTNGENNYIKPNHQSHIDPANGVPDDDADTWNEGWCGGRGSNLFSLPVRNQRKASGIVNRASSQPSMRPPIFSKDDVEFKAPTRARAIGKTSPQGVADDRWTTSYDTNYMPINERSPKSGNQAQTKRSPKNKPYKSQRTFQWRKRAAEKKAGLARAQNRPFAVGARKCQIPPPPPIY